MCAHLSVPEICFVVFFNDRLGCNHFENHCINNNADLYRSLPRVAWVHVNAHHQKGLCQGHLRGLGYGTPFAALPCGLGTSLRQWLCSVALGKGSLPVVVSDDGHTMLQAAPFERERIIPAP